MAAVIICSDFGAQENKGIGAFSKTGSPFPPNNIIYYIEIICTGYKLKWL